MNMAAPYKKPDVNEILRKYGAKIEGQMSTSAVNSGSYSNEYEKFKAELAPELTKYEKWCRSLGSFIKVNVPEKDAAEIRRHLKAAHLDVEPWQALTLALMSFLCVFMFGFFSSLAIALIKGSQSTESMLGGLVSSFPLMYFILMTVLSLFLYYFIKAYPERLANRWRLKASSQMVPAILYDVEVGKFSTIKESLDNYLDTWRGYSTEFIESFHLIESSLFEPDDARRINTLEKALQVVLDGVYEKMLKFTHNVRSPLTNVYMLGVVLPTLGLALLPLASAMLGS